MTTFNEFVGLRISRQPGAVPTAAQIGEGQLAFNLADRRIFARFGNAVEDITDRYTRQEVDSALNEKASLEALAAVATSGSYSDLADKPTLGTAAAQNVTAFDASGTATAALTSHTSAADPHAQYVKKEPGKGLSERSFTQAEKTKLAALESSRFKGQYPSLVALQGAYPSASAGDYANVDQGAGVDVVRYVWDSSDGAWVAQLGSSAQLTGAQIKQEYESQPDTNAFTDEQKTKLANVGSMANRNVYISAQPPDDAVGQDGDIWLQHWS